MTADVLDRASRCLVALHGAEWPQLWSATCWSDGAGVWLAPWPGADGGTEPRLCAVYVPAVRPGTPGLLATGALRSYGAAHPLRLALHGVTVSTALTALALRNPVDVLGEGALRPRRWLRRDPLVMRAVLEDARFVDPPEPGPGVAPALPTAVPADVRRTVAGARAVTAAFVRDGRVHAAPGVWSAGFRLSFPPTLSPPPGAAVTVVPEPPTGRRGRERAGVAVHGVVDDGHALVPARATIRRSARVELVELHPAAVGGVSLPD